MPKNQAELKLISPEDVAVEQAVTSNILATVCAVDQQELERLRNQCIQQIRKTNGMISFEQALRWQKDNREMEGR